MRFFAKFTFAGRGLGKVLCGCMIEGWLCSVRSDGEGRGGEVRWNKVRRGEVR